MGLGEGLRVDAKPTGKVCLIEAGGNRVTIEKYSFLLDVGFDGKQELREEFAKDQLLLTVALGAAPATARIGYNVAEIAKCVAPSFVFFFFCFSFAFSFGEVRNVRRRQENGHHHNSFLRPSFPATFRIVFTAHFSLLFLDTWT